jgi:hypothetical protein
LNVTAGTPAPFTLTFQTTTTAGTQVPPTTATPNSRRVSRTVAFVPGNHHDDDANGSSGSGPTTFVPVVAAGFLIAIAGFIVALIVPDCRSRQLAGALAFFLVLAMMPVIIGCHHKSSTNSTIPFTPTGTYTLTVQGSAQNAARGFTVTLVVD